MTEGRDMILSLAEWEYAHRYRDFVCMGDPAPDPSGFIPARVVAIHKTIRAEFDRRKKGLRDMRVPRR